LTPVRIFPRRKFVRKKYFAGAVAGVLALALAAVAIATPQLKQTAKVNYTKTKGKVSAGVNATLSTSDPGAQPPGNQPGVDSVVVNLKGARTDTKAGKRCTLPKSQAAQCPRSTKVGSGSAKANVVGTNASGQTIVAQNVFGGFNVTAYLANKALYLVVTSKTPGGPVTILKANLSKRGKLTANVKRDTAGALPPPNKIVLTDFKLKTKRKAKGKGRKKRILIRTPKCGKSKRFTVVSSFKFDDGTSKRVTHKQRCRR
jgi:hypothetical protein